MYVMEAIGVFAVAVGVVCFVLVAMISLRSGRSRDRSLGGGGPMVPIPRHGDGDVDGDSLDG